MQKLLLHMACSVTLAEDGAKALEHPSRRRFDGVFMDVQVPVMEGLEALKALRGGQVGYKIATTPVHRGFGVCVKEDREIFLAKGMDDYVMKPVDATLPEAVLMRFIERGTAESGA